jgi:Zn-dependent peptidase ImmA (M78 family)
MAVIESAADKLREQVGETELPVNPYAIAEKLGIPVCEDDATGYAGSLFRLGESCSISINANIPSEERKNFTLAHELGHHQLHPGKSTFRCEKKHFDVFRRDTPTPEQEANEFASCLLLPSELVTPFISIDGPTFRNVRELANEARTSVTATALRFVTCGAVPCALVLAKSGRIRWFRKTDDFPYYVLTGPVGPGTLAYGFHQNGTTPPADEAWEVPLDSWCETRGCRDGTIQEACFSMKKRGISLSLLYPSSGSEDALDEDEREVEWEEPRFKKR